MNATATEFKVGTTICGCYDSRLHVGPIRSTKEADPDTIAFREGLLGLSVAGPGSGEDVNLWFPSEHCQKGTMFTDTAVRRMVGFHDHWQVVKITAHTGRQDGTFVYGEMTAKKVNLQAKFFPPAAVAKATLDVDDPHLLAKLNAWFFSSPVVLGDVFTEFINQADRDCSVIEMKRTRYRIEFDMPNCTQQGWRTGVRVGDILFYKPGTV